MERTNLPKKQVPVIQEDDQVYEATLQSMEETIVRATDMVKQINARLIPLRDELNKLHVSGIENLVALFAINKMKALDQLLNPDNR
jgi:hypothetical protein